MPLISNYIHIELWHVITHPCPNSNSGLVYAVDVGAWFNSSPPSAAYMRHWIGSALVQIMACRLFGAKPLFKPMLLPIRPLWNFCEILIKMVNFSFIKLSSAKWWPFCPGGRWVNYIWQNPLNTWRNNNVVRTSKRCHFHVITSKWPRFDVITASILRNVSVGKNHVICYPGHNLCSSLMVKGPSQAVSISHKLS